jgi:hypothetical protein
MRKTWAVAGTMLAGTFVLSAAAVHAIALLGLLAFVLLLVCLLCEKPSRRLAEWLSLIFGRDWWQPPKRAAPSRRKSSRR